MGTYEEEWPIDTKPPLHRYKLWCATTQDSDYSMNCIFQTAKRKELEVTATNGPGDRHNWPLKAGAELRCPYFKQSNGFLLIWEKATLWPGFKERRLCCIPHFTFSHPLLPGPATLACLVPLWSHFPFWLRAFMSFGFVLLQAFEFQPTAFQQREMSNWKPLKEGKITLVFLCCSIEVFEQFIPYVIK